MRRQLERGDGDVYCDETRSLGELLIGFEIDADRKWNVNAMFLRESYGKIFPSRGVKFRDVKPASDFLKEKYGHGEPSAMFAAIRTWEEYLKCYSINHGPDMFTNSMTVLYRPFFLYGEFRPWQEEATAALAKTLHDGESQVELWYPVANRPFECVVAFSSFQPLIFYYMNKIEEWGFVFQQCKVCSKFFLALSKHYELCGNQCRKVQAVEAKRQFDERAKGDSPAQLYETTYNYWYNRLRSLKRANAAPEKIAAVNQAFAAFRSEANGKRAEVKCGGMPLSEFSSWLVQKQDEIDRLMES